jgi:solute carrier family 35 (UDP-galactose transporter), member B1
MFLSVLIAKKSYSLQKYVIVILIVGSISVFLLDSQQEHPNADNKIGLALVIGSLLLDGVTGATQDRVRSISKPSTFEFMYYVNYFSFWMLTCVMAFTGEGKEFIQFCMTFPLVLAHISIAIFFGIFGQYFMSAIVSNFGALPCSLVTTIRKFFTVLFSVLSFDNSLSTVQWISTSVIFLSLFVDVIYSKKSTKSNSMTPQSGVINLTFDSVVICDDKIDESKKSEDNNNINNSDNMYIITR